MKQPNLSSSPLILTMGDPAGIGPEVMVKALAERLGRPGGPYIIVAAAAVMEAAVARFGSSRLRTLMGSGQWRRSVKDLLEPRTGPLMLLSASRLAMNRIAPGQPDAAAGQAAWDCLEAAMALMRAGAAKALVTAPVTKSSLQAAGFPYPGHTDWLAAQTGGRAVMMLTAGRFRVVPLTVHIPLAAVPRAITPKRVFETIVITAAELIHRFRIKRPRLAISGLNPHAGESGMLGREEETAIAPAIAAARASGLDVRGPLPADTMFTPSARQSYDAAICMYHDQALIPLKTLAMHRGVNLTLGLPIIRTSPAHGAAPDIAWQGIADHRSMGAAIDLAEKMARKKRS
jgi:4-hydroxythreonine-4-phosphate dehydrogenase